VTPCCLCRVLTDGVCALLHCRLLGKLVSRQRRGDGALTDVINTTLAFVTPVCAGNAALAQAMCGAVVDVAAMVVALPPPAATAGGGGGSPPPHPAVAEAAVEAEERRAAQLLLPYPAALRHNDCHYVYQASWLPLVDQCLWCLPSPALARASQPWARATLA
jgi:hypothetical protein